MKFRSKRRCGCKSWAHTTGCKLGLGGANAKRHHVAYYSGRPLRAARVAKRSKRKRAGKR